MSEWFKVPLFTNNTTTWRQWHHHSHVYRDIYILANTHSQCSLPNTSFLMLSSQCSLLNFSFPITLFQFALHNNFSQHPLSDIPFPISHPQYPHPNTPLPPTYLARPSNITPSLLQPEEAASSNFSIMISNLEWGDLKRLFAKVSLQRRLPENEDLWKVPVGV